MLKEFKQFISKGNVLEIAVGLIMASYFGTIVKSMVDDILMPPFGKLLGGIDFSTFKLLIQKPVAAVMDGSTIISPAIPEIAIRYGSFINSVITFLIVAFCIFLVVKAYNKMKEKMEKKEAENTAKAPPAPSKEEILLTEIRDLLKNKNI
jgi:large conductance mechanosensitive channel